jgi:hypothetical protein
MPIISRGLPVEDSGGFGGAFAAANAVDSDYSTSWRVVNVPSGGSPQRLVINISSVSNANKTTALFAWYNDPATGTYYLTDAQSSTNYNNEPRDYKIQGHTASGGGAAPTVSDVGWVDLVTVTANTKHSRQHAVNLSGYNWCQFRVTASNGDPVANGDVIAQIDIHNIAAGNQDNWIFLGDSITAEAFGRKNIDGSAWTNGPLATLINTARPLQFPLMENGGQPGQNIAFCDTNKATLLSGFTGKYVGIAFGANDASGPTSAANYYTSLLSVVDYVIGLGKVPVVPKVTKRTDGAGVPDGFVVQYNAQIDALYAARTAVIPGPDLYAKVADGTIVLRDGLHPTFSGAGNGYEALLNCWRDTLLARVY